MFGNRRNFSVSFLFLIVEIVVSVIGTQDIEFDNDLAKKDIFSLKHLNIPKSFSKVLSHSNWTNNQKCFTELNAIKTGLENNERWAIQGELMKIFNDLFWITKSCNDK